MRYAYNIICYLAIPFILLRLLWKSRRNLHYLKYIPQRFGYIKKPLQKGGIWLHAVSVGEVIASVPLVKRLQAVYPDLPITITTMTPTGADRVFALFENTVAQSYVPYDLSGAMRRFLNRLEPKLVIIMETEIWPNFLYICRQHNIPSMLANARLSERSAKGYRRLGRFATKMMNDISLIAAQSQADADRFKSLGAKDTQLRITGSIKFDQKIPASAHEKAAVFRSLWGADRLVLLAASTHEGEEELVLQAFRKIREKFPHLLLALVPRHPERFTKVTALCRKQGYVVMLRSQNSPCPDSVDIFIGDSMGELSAFYAASDVAFVGGSLMPTGGHNLLEPAALGVAAITGSHVFNFAEITNLLESAGAIKKVVDVDGLADAVVMWLDDSTLRSEAGEKGLKVVEQNKGAVEAHLALLQELLT